MVCNIHNNTKNAIIIVINSLFAPVLLYKSITSVLLQFLPKFGFEWKQNEINC